MDFPFRSMLAALVLTSGLSAAAYEVSVGTYVVNAGRTVTVPVMLDSAAGLSYASATISYDPQVLIVTKAEAGTLRALMAEDFVATDTNGTLMVSIFGSTAANVTSGSGSIANVTFAVRAGTEGLYSDVTVTDVELGEKTGVRDVTVGNPLTTVNGMVRVFGSGATVARLEHAQTIVADTTLASLALKDGDALQASDSQTAIVVAGATTSEAATIPIREPVNGWASGDYELLKTTTAGLTLALEEVAGAAVTYSNVTVAGITTYFAKVTIVGELPVICDDPEEDIGAGGLNQIRKNAKLAFEGKDDAGSLAKQALFDRAKRIRIAGPKGLIATIADMGISPAFPTALDETGTLRLTYAAPRLELVSFDPSNGAVRFKVTPGEGNQIVSSINNGYIHVYGTSDLGEKMSYVSAVGFDLSPYLKAETKGEGVLKVTLGTHTFLKVKIEACEKTNGEME